MTHDLVADFATHQQRLNYSPRSIPRYYGTLRSLERHAGRPVEQIGTDDILAWVHSTSCGPSTRRCYLSSVRSFYRWALREESIDRDPSACIDLPRTRRGLPRPITPADLALALGNADERMRCWLLLAALQGFRCQEIAGLAVEDLILYQQPPLLVVTHAKGGRERTLPLHPAVADALEAYEPPRSGPVFPSTTGRAYRAQTVSDIGNRFLRGLGIGATMHQLRHRFASDVYRLSRDLRLTQELMGHQSPATTAIYAAWAPGEAVGIVNQLELP